MESLGCWGVPASAATSNEARPRLSSCAVAMSSRAWSPDTSGARVRLLTPILPRRHGVHYPSAQSSVFQGAVFMPLPRSRGEADESSPGRYLMAGVTATAPLPRPPGMTRAAEHDSTMIDQSPARRRGRVEALDGSARVGTTRAVAILNTLLSMRIRLIDDSVALGEWRGRVLGAVDSRPVNVIVARPVARAVGVRWNPAKTRNLSTEITRSVHLPPTVIVLLRQD